MESLPISLFLRKSLIRIPKISSCLVRRGSKIFLDGQPLCYQRNLNWFFKCKTLMKWFTMQQNSRENNYCKCWFPEAILRSKVPIAKGTSDIPQTRISNCLKKDALWEIPLKMSRYVILSTHRLCFTFLAIVNKVWGPHLESRFVIFETCVLTSVLFQSSVI